MLQITSIMDSMSLHGPPTVQSKPICATNSVQPKSCRYAAPTNDSFENVDDDGHASGNASYDGQLPYDSRNDVWRNGNDARSKRFWTTWIRRFWTTSQWSVGPTKFWRWRIWDVSSTATATATTGLRAATLWGARTAGRTTATITAAEISRAEIGVAREEGIS